MSEPKCPNCGRQDFSCITNLERTSVLLWCGECGTRWNTDGSGVATPTRSQPAEIVSLPMCEGQWLWRRKDEKRWSLVDIELRGHRAEPYIRFTSEDAPSGQYVKFVPPILPPPKRDEDAEKLRLLATWFDDVNPYRGCRPISKDDLYRIASDLEKLRGAK